MCGIASPAVRLITLFHSSFHLEAAFGLTRQDVASLEWAHERTTRVFVSAMKRRSWGLDGTVVARGSLSRTTDPTRATWRRSSERGNLHTEFSELTGARILETVTAGFPVTTARRESAHA